MVIKGSCECGATQFAVAERPETITRCTCSFRTKRGALGAYLDQEDDFVLATASDRVSTYQWGSYQTARLVDAVRGPARLPGIGRPSILCPESSRCR
jgi:hypothetical protein